MEKALALNPNFVPAMGARGFGKIYNGAPLEAIPDLQRAMRLDPLMGHQYRHFIGTAYLVAGQYEEAVEAFRERIRMAPGTDLSRGLLISALGHIGETDEAQRVWVELKHVNSKYSLAEHLARLPFNNPVDADLIKEGFRQEPGAAGLKATVRCSACDPIQPTAASALSCGVGCPLSGVNLTQRPSGCGRGAPFTVANLNDFNARPRATNCARSFNSPSAVAPFCRAAKTRPDIWPSVAYPADCQRGAGFLFWPCVRAVVLTRAILAGSI